MKRTMKLLALVMALVMLVGMLAACGNKPAVEDQGGDDAAVVETLDRAALAIPNDYTKVKVFSGTFDFGEAEITAAMNDDESAFYMTYMSFDELQILEGTVQNGICMVTYDQTGFMAIAAQSVYEAALASEEAWCALAGEGPLSPADVVMGEEMDRAELAIPNDYTKVKIFSDTFDFGEAEITAAMNDDESAFYMTYMSFNEQQILIGTVQNGICMVTYDQTGFMAIAAQSVYETALASAEVWHPLTGEGPAAPSK